MTTLADLSVDDLRRRLAGIGARESHAIRILRALYRSGRMPDPAELNLPAGLLPRLGFAAETDHTPLAVVARSVAADGTVKLLLRTRDGRTIESVLMSDFRADRVAGCVSSQVGCAMGCDFCATAQGGFSRNLTAGEIAAQFLALRREAGSLGKRLRTLVFMGMGEPLLNLEAVVEAVRRIAGPELGSLGWAQVTVSTVGIVPGIEALQTTGLRIPLAISLHAPDDATRARLLPVGRRFGAAAIVDAASRYAAASGRTATVQYCLLEGVNDSEAQAGELAELLLGRRMHVNLLHYNPTGAGLSGAHYRASSDEAAERFRQRLADRGVVAHFRRPRGRDIDAACGQLRRRWEARPVPENRSP